MRIVLVGRPRDRERLRRALADTSVDIVGEAATLAIARAVAVDADAFLVNASTPATAGRDVPADEIEVLTPRETEVLELVAEGLPNKAIGIRLGISDQTVKFHVASVAGKLGARNRTDAVRIAIQKGIVGI